MVRMLRIFALHTLGIADDRSHDPYRVLFVGNSFTYGPPPYDRYDQLQMNNLPRMFKLIAESMGKKVEVGEDTLGGCTLYQHMPSRNPEACTDPSQCRIADTARMPAKNECTVPAEFMNGSALFDDYHPCPQLLTRQPYGPWDFVVMQDHSALATVPKARDSYMYPAFEEYKKVLRKQGVNVRKREPKIAAYMTWSYLHGGTMWMRGVQDLDVEGTAPPWAPGQPPYTNDTGYPRSRCPAGWKTGCYPLGTLDELDDCSNSNFHEKMETQACHGYSIARGMAETLRHGADIVVPAGLAWQIARGSEEIPSHCKDLIDAEYPDAGPLASLKLPLQASKKADVRWKETSAAEKLFRDLGPNFTSPYCPENEDCTNDHHPSEIGMYLNALVFYATIFKDSPIGAAVPDNKTVVDGMILPAVDPDVADSLQRIAHDTVMDNMDVWWGKTSNSDVVV